MNQRPNFFNKYNRPFEDGEVRGDLCTSTPSKVDIKGYIPMRKQVQTLLANGERLEAYRRGELYDSEDNWTPSPLADPDIIPSVDVPRISEELAVSINERIKQDRESSSVTERSEREAENSTVTPSAKEPIKEPSSSTASE